MGREIESGQGVRVAVKKISEQDCKDCSWCNIPTREKMYQITIKYTPLPQNIPNGRKIDQMTIKFTNTYDS
jgi:hypothetical protein